MNPSEMEMSEDKCRQTDFHHLPVIRTFPAPATDDLFAEALSFAGIKVMDAPMIETVPVPFSLPNPIEAYNWLIFTSKNALQSFFSAHPEGKKQKIAVIGESTAQHLRQMGINPAFTGSGHSGRRFAEELLPVLDQDDTLLLVTGALATSVVPEILSAKHVVHRVDVYDTRMPASINTQAIGLIEKGHYSIIAVSSPSAVNNLLSLIQDQKKLRFASIGTVTSAALRQHGIEPFAESAEQSYEALANTIINALTKKHKL